MYVQGNLCFREKNSFCIQNKCYERIHGSPYHETPIVVEETLKKKKKKQEMALAQFSLEAPPLASLSSLVLLTLSLSFPFSFAPLSFTSLS